MLTEQLRDKVYGSNKVGSTDFGVKQKVNPYSWVGGGLKGARVVVWDPLGQSHKTTKVGWMAEVTESRADRLPCK